MNPISRLALRSFIATSSGLWSPSSDRRLNILIFHRVRPTPDPLFPEEPDSQQFDRLMAVLAENFNCLALDEAIEMLDKGVQLPARGLAITFDDGYADNRTEAMPILKKHGLTATFFVASGHLDGGLMWNDELIELIRCFPKPSIDLRPLDFGIASCATIAERRALIDRLLIAIKYRQPLERRKALDKLLEITGGNPPRNLMMTSAQVREMREHGMIIGGHTLGHPILSTLNDQEARREICEDRENLCGILGKAPRLFAYPNGKPGKDYDARHPAIVREAGYRAAFSTAWGSAHHGDDLLQLPRFTPWDQSAVRFAIRLAHNYSRSAEALA